LKVRLQRCSGRGAESGREDIQRVETAKPHAKLPCLSG
jgi:hypothetical protein